MTDIFLIKKPWITEKSGDLSLIGKYVFLVSPSATKNEVKKALREIYKVDAVDVNITNLPRKRKSFRNMKGMQEQRKKAVVTLKKGQKIDLQ
jgi:large subunit ribosomal protein L23